MGTVMSQSNFAVVSGVVSVGQQAPESALGHKLQDLRKAANLTQQQLCERANISFSTLTKIERGAIKSPSIFTVHAVTQVLGVSIDEMLGGHAPTGSGRTFHKTRSGASFIYFDVNGCLVRFYQRAFSRLAEVTGAPSDVVETAFWHYNDEACRGVISLEDFNHKLAKRIGVDSVDWQQYYLETIESIQPMHEVVEWAAQNYKVGLLTNIMPGLLTALRRDNLVPNIGYDAVVDSSEIGAIKPEPHIFDVAKELAGVPGNEILLIDDTRSNLMAAEKAGWKVLWFDDARAEESAQRVKDALQPAD